MIEPVENGANENPVVALELTLSAIKEYLLMNGGKVKYADLYNRFRDLIIDSTTGIFTLLIKHLLPIIRLYISINR